MTLKLADKNGGSYTIIGDVRDLSGDEDLRRRLRYMEFYDQNTGAYNRKYMMTLLENIFHHESEYMEHSSEHFEDVGGKDYLCFIHVNNLKYIRDTVGLDYLKPQLAAIAQVRLENPDMNLASLGEMLDPVVGKSGVNHRLRKISEIAEELRGQG
jgi:hypothetical protein